jgi:hypothetical protein
MRAGKGHRDMAIVSDLVARRSRARPLFDIPNWGGKRAGCASDNSAIVVTIDEADCCSRTPNAEATAIKDERRLCFAPRANSPHPIAATQGFIEGATSSGTSVPYSSTFSRVLCLRFARPLCTSPASPARGWEPDTSVLFRCELLSRSSTRHIPTE